MLTDLGTEHDMKTHPGSGEGFISDHGPSDATPMLRLLAVVSGTRCDEPAAAELIVACSRSCTRTFAPGDAP